MNLTTPRVPEAKSPHEKKTRSALSTWEKDTGTIRKAGRSDSIKLLDFYRIYVTFIRRLEVSGDIKYIRRLVSSNFSVGLQTPKNNFSGGKSKIQVKNIFWENGNNHSLDSFYGNPHYWQQSQTIKKRAILDSLFHSLLYAQTEQPGTANNSREPTYRMFIRQITSAMSKLVVNYGCRTFRRGYSVLN